MDDERAVIDRDSCVGCGKCTQTCPVKAISMAAVPVQKTLPERDDDENAPSAQAKKAFIDPNVCFSCGSCAEVCPTKAIVLDESDTPRPVIRSKCIGCGKCVTYCQARAITLR
jgi:NAD-dependent dihydropyrimidine dehydrogenase PreA subunit